MADSRCLLSCEPRVQYPHAISGCPSQAGDRRAPKVDVGGVESVLGGREAEAQWIGILAQVKEYLVGNKNCGMLWMSAFDNQIACPFWVE